MTLNWKRKLEMHLPLVRVKLLMQVRHFLSVPRQVRQGLMQAEHCTGASTLTSLIAVKPSAQERQTVLLRHYSHPEGQLRQVAAMSLTSRNWPTWQLVQRVKSFSSQRWQLGLHWKHCWLTRTNPKGQTVQLTV